MSELKSVYIDRTGDWFRSENDTGKFYLKSEADKVIAHQKFKRCLAMAKWCDSKVYHIRRTPLCDMSEHEYWQYENDFWQRWQKRWNLPRSSRRHMTITVKCDNCGAEYVAFDTDKNKEPFWHRVCDTCYMPMKVENPFYKETK